MASCFFCDRLSSAQLDRWQAPKQRPIIDPHPVEQTAYRGDIKDNGYKFLAGTSKEQVVDKGIRQKSTKEWTHSLTAVPFSSRTMSRHMLHDDTTPGQTRTKAKLRVYTPSDANWLTNNNKLYDFFLMQACDFSGFFLISGFFTNLPLLQNVLERREVATQERKK